MKKIGSIFEKIRSFLYYICLIFVIVVRFGDYVHNTRVNTEKRKIYAEAGAIPYLKKANEYVMAKNYSQAIPYLKKVNELVGGNDPDCQYFIGSFYEESGNNTQAVYWWRKAAGLGDLKSQRCLGNAYYHGEGVTKDDVQAVYWWRKAAEQGDLKTQHYLGVCYEEGIGVAKDDTQAVYWWRKAAEQGVADARYKLGNAYHNGEGVAKDNVQAASWWRKAAQQGVGDAQGQLSLCYYRGDGIAKDLKQAKFWAREAIADENTSPETIKILQETVLQ